MSTSTEGPTGGGKPRRDRSKVSAAVTNAFLLGAAGGGIGVAVAGTMSSSSAGTKQLVVVGGILLGMALGVWIARNGFGFLVVIGGAIAGFFMQFMKGSKGD